MKQNVATLKVIKSLKVLHGKKPFTLTNMITDNTVFGDKRYHVTDNTFQFKDKIKLCFDKRCHLSKSTVFIQLTTYSYIIKYKFIHGHVTFFQTSVIYTIKYHT